MIKHHIGLLRNLIEKRSEVVQLVKQYLEADDIIVMSIKDSQFTATGRVHSPSHALVMLGKALALNWPTAKAQHPEVELAEYLTQPASIALAAINKEAEQ